jgi:SNF2 family DNA or RNA helicase
MVNGSIKDLSNYEQESNSVTLVQYKAGAMGLNLQKANKIVYFSLTEEAELFEQSKKRIHRIGQEKPCFYYMLICQNSIEDQEILPTLNVRKEYTDDLFEKTN